MAIKEGNHQTGRGWEKQSSSWEWVVDVEKMLAGDDPDSTLPIYGDPNLVPMEEHKRRALVHLIKRSQKPLQDFISAIDEVAEGAFESRHQVEMDGKINLMVLDFLGRTDEGRDMANMSLRHHPLQLYHGSLTYKEAAHEVPQESESKEYKYEMMPSTLEMHEAGIKFRKSERDNLLGIDFKGGLPTMPAIMVHDGTESLYLNLMAFERLHCNVGDLVTAYVFFMDDMIVSSNDVAILSSKGVLENLLGCDKEVAKLFNGTLNRGQLLSPWHALHDVQSKVNAYCRYKWRATLLRTYFRNPWAIISPAAAVILLIATLLQTIFTIMPNKS